MKHVRQHARQGTFKEKIKNLEPRKNNYSIENNQASNKTFMKLKSKFYIFYCLRVIEVLKLL